MGEKKKPRDSRGNSGSVEARAVRAMRKAIRPGITRSELGRDLTKKAKPIKRPPKPTKRR